MDRIQDEESRANTKNAEVLCRAWERWERAQDERASQIFSCAAAFFVLLFALGSGCAQAEKAFYAAHAVKVEAVRGAYRALDKADAGKVEEILAMPREEGRKAFAEYKPKIKAARRTLGAISDELDLSFTGSRVYKLVANKDWIGALAELTKAMIPLMDILRQFGLEVPL